MILSHYERADSPYVRIQFADARGRKRYVKTNIRKDDPEKARKIAKALNQVEARILEGNSKPLSQASWSWVSGYIRTRYAAKASTRHTYLIQWDRLRAYLEQTKIPGPGLLERADVFGYVEWRTSQVKQKSRRNPSINTAIGELKLLGLILDEAEARGLIAKNPARKLNLQRTEPPLKPALNDEEIATIYPTLATDWQKRSFHIGLHTALRFAETRIARNKVDWKGKHITIEEPKGGRRRAFGIEIYPTIREMIEEFMDSKEPYLWTMPEKERVLSGLIWRDFFDALGLSHICFHCTRVTFITRGALARPPVPEAVMMAMVNHGSKEIHRIYQRIAAPDALRFRDQIAIPTYSFSK